MISRGTIAGQGIADNLSYPCAANAVECWCIVSRTFETDR